MARPWRIDFEGAVYHVTSRGNARQEIFLDDKDCADFIEVLKLVVLRFNWKVHAYCLMSNHYHILIETPEGNLSNGMRQLNGVYTQRFNRKHGRVGHILQGRFKAILVEKQNYLLALARYIVLNPVRVGIVKNPEQWQWSSYGATADNNQAVSWITTDWILSQFGGERKEAVLQYKKFVRQGMNEESPLIAVRGQIMLGRESFIEEIKHLLSDKGQLKEVPRIQRHVTRPSLKEIFNRSDKKSKRRLMCTAHVNYGYMLKEIAEHCGVHYTTVSKAISTIVSQQKK